MESLCSLEGTEVKDQSRRSKITYLLTRCFTRVLLGGRGGGVRKSSAMSSAVISTTGATASLTMGRKAELGEGRKPDPLGFTATMRGCNESMLTSVSRRRIMDHKRNAKFAYSSMVRGGLVVRGRVEEARRAGICNKSSLTSASLGREGARLSER